MKLATSIENVLILKMHMSSSNKKLYID